MDKPKLKYSVVTGKKPGTSETLLRPIITDRITYYINSVVEYALNSGYVRGQVDDMTGIVRGFFRACKELVNSGFCVNLADWIRIHPELTGTLGEDRQLSNMTNGINVNITPLSEMKKLTVDDFTWQSTEDTGARVKVNAVFSVGSEPGNIVKSQAIMVTGNNLYWRNALGDQVTIDYEGLSTPLAITPLEQDFGHMKFNWPTALDDVEDGTIFTFKFKLHGGVEGAPEQVLTKNAVYHTT